MSLTIQRTNSVFTQASLLKQMQLSLNHGLSSHFL
jgi:hypothetical protein